MNVADIYVASTSKVVVITASRRLRYLWCFVANQDMKVGHMFREKSSATGEKKRCRGCADNGRLEKAKQKVALEVVENVLLQDVVLSLSSSDMSSARSG